jgi:hypothetical protein
MTRALPFTEMSVACAIKGVERAGRFVVGVKIMPKPRVLGAKRLAWDVHELNAAADALPHQGESSASSEVLHGEAT